MERYKYNVVVGCSNEGDNLMVMIIEIIIGTLILFLGILLLRDAHKDYIKKSTWLVFDLIGGIILILIGIIIGTNNLFVVSDIIVNILMIEVNI